MHSEDYPLTWGQQMFWWMDKKAPVHVRGRMNFIRQFASGIEVSPDLLLEAVAHLTRRHSGLRTTFPTGADGQPVQRVQPWRSPGISVTLVDTQPDVSWEQDCSALYVRAKQHSFDLSTEWPVHIFALQDDIRVRYILACIGHIAIDHIGFQLLNREFNETLRGLQQRLAPDRPTNPISPGSAALLENSEAGRRRNARSLEYWRKALTDVPAWYYPWVEDPVAPEETYRAALNSRAVRLAQSLGSIDSQSSFPATLLAATVMMIHFQVEHKEILVGFRSSNRVPPFTDYIGSITQKSVFRLSIDGDAAMSSLARDIYDKSISSIHRSRCDYFDTLATIHGVASERGVPLRRGPGYNIDFNCILDDEDGAGEVTPEILTRSMSSTTDIQWRPHGIEGEITVDILSKEDSVEISLIANSRRLSREKAEEFLLGLESIIVGFYSGMDLTISQLKRRLEIERTAGTEFTFTRGGWVDVDNVRKAVLSIRGVKDAAVIADGDEIVARVTVDGEFDHTRSSRAALAAAARLQNAIAPSRWEIIKSDDSTAEEATGAGSEPCDRERSDKIDAISRTFFELNSVRLESLEPSYIEAGGSVAKIPEFIDRMNQRGWFGVAVEDLVGFDALTEVGDRIFRKFEM